MFIFDDIHAFNSVNCLITTLLMLVIIRVSSVHLYS